MVIDWQDIQKKYAGKWVAFATDEKTVLAPAPTLKTAHKRTLQQGYKNLIMSPVPKKVMTFVGHEV